MLVLADLGKNIRFVTANYNHLYYTDDFTILQKDQREGKKAVLEALGRQINLISPLKYQGRVKSIKGMMVEASGLEDFLKIGSRCLITNQRVAPIIAEVVGFQPGSTLLMPFDNLSGIGLGDTVTRLTLIPNISPHKSWLGRVIDCTGAPIDSLGPLADGDSPYTLNAHPIAAHERHLVGERLDVGVKAVNTFTAVCRGQRLGVFAGSGIGKSILLSMFTRFTKADVVIVGLIGERGREVKEFLDKHLDSETLKRTVVVVATSDESPMRRKNAAFMTMTIAEYFRDLGKDVLCLMDSVTRFAMAQREIGLSAGEPPASKGYTPTVFSELPKLLERAGPGRNDKGNITGLFTVLVEGDDHNEPISDAVRGILDGHIVLDRALADRGHYPAINILRSISRTMPDCHSNAENKLVQRARKLIATYEDMAEMIRLGAYRMGSDPAVDEAIRFNPKLMGFLAQDKHTATSIQDAFKQLEDALNESPQNTH